jgi:hypothetical protein
MIDVANKWEDGEMKNALIMVIANHMTKSYLSWNKDTVKDDVIFEHLYELSGGTINLQATEEELSNSTDLMRVNKKLSNKTQFVNPKQKMQHKPNTNGKNGQNNKNNRKS